MLKRVMTIIAYMLGIYVFFALIFLIIDFFGLKDNRPNVKKDAESLMYIAQLKYYNDAMLKISDRTSCYDISELNYKNHGMQGDKASGYKGSILISGDANNPTIKIWLSDGESFAEGSLNNITVKYDKKTADSNCYLEK